MSTYTAKCDICGTENTVASYGDWDCRKCGQGYTYDECHQIRLTDAQWSMLRNPPRWVPVEERLPEPHEKVIALDDCGNAHIAAQHQFEEDAPFARGTCSHRVGSLWTNEWRAISGVTHWMPLPEPPEVQ